MRGVGGCRGGIYIAVDGVILDSRYIIGVLMSSESSSDQNERFRLYAVSSQAFNHRRIYINVSKIC